MSRGVTVALLLYSQGVASWLEDGRYAAQVAVKFRMGIFKVLPERYMKSYNGMACKIQELQCTIKYEGPGRETFPISNF